MVPSIRFVLCAIFVFKNIIFCGGQQGFFRNYATTESPLPFPSCRVDSIDCLRRGMRTFFILMDNGHLGMKPIDPIIINSVAISLPDHEMSFLLRKVNVTGGRWTKLIDRRSMKVFERVKNFKVCDLFREFGGTLKYLNETYSQYLYFIGGNRANGALDGKRSPFNLNGGKNGVLFNSDLHVTGEISIISARRADPYVAALTMDIQGVESNITYSWSGERGIDNEDYIALGPERIAVRNARVPTFFLEPKDSKDALAIEQELQMKQSIVDHLANEITTELMHSVVDNFRLFASKVPVRHYYIYY